MSDLDDLADDFAVDADWKPKTRRWRTRGERATHCRRGHPLTDGNVYVRQYADGIHRICKQCHRLHYLNYRDRSERQS